MGTSGVRRKFLRDEIERQGKTQQEVARDAGLHHNTVWNTVNNSAYNPTFDTLKRIAKVLRIHVVDLISDEQ